VAVLFSDSRLRSIRAAVIWRPQLDLSNIGRSEKNFKPLMKVFRFENCSTEEPAMISNGAAIEGYEISPRFQRTLEERIAKLERDAQRDEAQVAMLIDGDHIRRQMRLVAMQRSEALRMRLFLDRSTVRLPRPLIEI
jgi:hypothetical protein